MVFVLVGLLILNKRPNTTGLMLAGAIIAGGYYYINHMKTTESFAPLDNAIDDQVSDNDDDDDDDDDTVDEASLKLKARDLLPNNEGWSESNPRIVDREGNYMSPQKANLMNMPSSLQGMMSNNIGVANNDLRCLPPIKKLSGLSPWNISTVEPDVYRRGISISDCPEE